MYNKKGSFRAVLRNSCCTVVKVPKEGTEMKNTNSLQYGFACGLGGFIGAVVSLQFAHNWLMGTIGLILGTTIGWVSALFANDPKGFPKALHGAFYEARRSILGANYSGLSIRFRFFLWNTVAGISGLLTLYSGAYLFMDVLDMRYIGAIFVIALLVCGVVGLAYFCATTIECLSDQGPVENDITTVREFFHYTNPILGPFYFVMVPLKGSRSLWVHRLEILQATKIFLAQMYLYLHANDGLAMLANVALATGVGFYFDQAFVGAVVGFIAGFTDKSLYNKSQENLRILVANKN